LNVRGISLSEEIELLIRQLAKRKGLKTWHVVLLGDIIGEKLKEKLPEILPTVKVEIPAPPPPVTPIIRRIELPKPKTETIDKKNFTVKGNFELLNVKLRGELKELLIKSPSPNFSILLMCDNIRIMDRKFTELQEVTQELDFIAAFEDNGSYILNIKDIKWIDQCMILLTAHEQITFQNIFARYDLFIV